MSILIFLAHDSANSISHLISGNAKGPLCTGVNTKGTDATPVSWKGSLCIFQLVSLRTFMASGDAAFSVVISIEQLKRLDRAKNLAGESSRSAFVRDALESHIARRKAKPNLSGPGLDKGVGTYVKKIGITLSSSNNLEFLDEIVDSENTSRSRFVREFIDSFVD